VVCAIVQDDLTCLVVGSAVAAGEAQPLPAAIACLAGIWFGDIAWFGLTRLIGQRVLLMWPFRVVVSPDKLEAARMRFERLGPRALFASRFLPIVRTPLQVAAGLAARSAVPGCLVLLVAGVIYVSLFIGTAATVGQLDVVRDFYQRFGAAALLVVPVLIWCSVAALGGLLLKTPRDPG
jgi:membrane protein DedA with SNARE-associated domain